MDISKITDVKELKALAYDQLILKEQVDANLQALTERITELQGGAKGEHPAIK